MASKFAASEIYELTECPVCMERFSRTRAPKVLSCSHTVCEQCVSSLVRDQKLLCPVCRGEIDVPQGDVTKITTNLTVLHIAELQPLSKCQECGLEKKNSKCFHCETKICGNCLKKHTQDTQTEIRKLRDQLENSNVSIESFQERLDSRISLFKANATTNIHQIQNVFKILENKLNQRRDTLIAKVKEFERTTEQEYNTIKTVMSEIQTKISSVLSEVQTSLPNVEEHHTKRSIDDLRATCPNIMNELNIISSGCKVTFPQIWISTRIDAVQIEIEKWGTVTSDEGVTVMFSDAETVPIDPLTDYTQRGQLMRQLSLDQGQVNDNDEFENPTGVDVDPVTGEMFVADFYQDQVHVFDASGQHVRSFGGEGSELGEIKNPRGVCVNHNGEVIVCGSDRCVFTLAGECSREFGQHGSGEGALSGPTDVTVDDNDNMFVTSTHDHCVKVYTNEGSYIRSFGEQGSEPGTFEYPTYIQWSRGRCVICDHTNGVQLWSDGGEFIRSIGAHTDPDPLINPQGVAADQHGNILVIDVGDHTIKVYSSEGEFITKFAVAECETDRENWCFLTCTPDAMIVSDFVSRSLLFY